VSHIELPAELQAAPVNDPPPDSGALRPFVRVVDFVNRCMLTVGMIGFFAASCVLTYSVGSRYFFKAGTDWQDEAAVFCLLGATFFCGAYVQSQRGHIGIEAVAGILPAHVNRVRRAVVDVFALAFCAFFAWKSWTLWYEAVVDHQTTSSTWAPPLWIPYGIMSLGMTLLCVQLALQVASHFIRGARGLAR
jgi:TRAP-type C4-dicarboxylate transport system permease small subunit